MVSMYDYKHYYPNQISGEQRVSIARAIVNNPDIIWLRTHWHPDLMA